MVIFRTCLLDNLSVVIRTAWCRWWKAGKVYMETISEDRPHWHCPEGEETEPDAARLNVSSWGS